MNRPGRSARACSVVHQDNKVSRCHDRLQTKLLFLVHRRNDPNPIIPIDQHGLPSATSLLAKEMWLARIRMSTPSLSTTAWAPPLLASTTTPMRRSGEAQVAAEPARAAVVPQDARHAEEQSRKGVQVPAQAHAHGIARVSGPLAERGFPIDARHGRPRWPRAGSGPCP